MDGKWTVDGRIKSGRSRTCQDGLDVMVTVTVTEQKRKINCTVILPSFYWERGVGVGWVDRYRGRDC